MTFKLAREAHPAGQFWIRTTGGFATSPTFFTGDEATATGCYVEADGPRGIAEFSQTAQTAHVSNSSIPHCGILLSGGRCAGDHDPAAAEVQGHGINRGGSGKRGGATNHTMQRKTGATTKTFGTELIEGMKVVLAHQRGKIGLEQVWPKPIDVKAIRRQVKMSQAEFSRAYGISKRALQEWEQGGRQPDSAARAYLTVIAKEPAVVLRALAGE